jgi:hypothetical protein
LSQTVAVLTQAVESNERQITGVAQTSAQGIKDLSSLIEKQGVQSASRHEQLATAFQTSQRPNYMLWIATISVLFVLIGAAWKITDAQTQLTVAPMVGEVRVLKERADEARQDLTLNRQMLSDQSSNQRVLVTRLAEIETQFRSSDSNRNIQFAEQQRMNNIIFQLAQGKGGKDNPIDYPVYPYFFPNVAPNSAPQ